MPFKNKEARLMLMVGAMVAMLAAVLVELGNPANMGLCIVCFLRDTSGALGLHRAGVVQYIRPEIIGISLGAFIMAFSRREFRPCGGSAPFTRFILGIFVVIGALVFLGCPLRMVLRLANGDLNALLGLVGFVAGIFSGVFFLNRGFTLKRTYASVNLEGYLFPALQLVFLVLLVVSPAFIFFSAEGPGSMKAPLIIALVAGVLVGAGAQRSRLCMSGGIRDAILFKDPHLLYGFMGIFAVSLLANLILGNFTLGFTGQPVAHNDGLWNFLGMMLTGFGAVLLGGCPLRQLILGAEGNMDSVITIMGMYVGTAISHNFGLAASGAGVPLNGKVAVMIGFAVVLTIGVLNSEYISIFKVKGDANLGTHSS